MINAFKGDTLLAPLSKTGFEARYFAASNLMRIDSGRSFVGLEARRSKDFYVQPLGAILRARDTKGYVAGLSLGASYNRDDYINKIYLSYAYGAARQDLSTQRTQTKANLFQIGTMNRYKFSLLESDLNANFLLGNFNINNEWQEDLLNSTSTFSNYQLLLGLTVGARFGEKFSIKPFVGLANYLEWQEGFTTVLGFESNAYNAYVLDANAGLEGHYMFNDLASIYSKASFEQRLYNSHKHLFLRSNATELRYENKSYDSAINVSLGAQILSYKSLRLNVEGLFRHYNTGLNYYGGSLLFKYGIN
ncbi:hypothetical protein DMC01_12995 [Campylobacter troglodytis]|nr:hypothetical protein DMC01_12995 [Campylobacter troglodytis]